MNRRLTCLYLVRFARGLAQFAMSSKVDGTFSRMAGARASPLMAPLVLVLLLMYLVLL